MSVYQQIKDKFIMKNAWDDWTSYRDQLTDLVIGHLMETQSQESTPASIMIIGAGRCNDIDLQRLVASAENVLLLDLDMEAMHEAVMALPERCRVIIHLFYYEGYSVAEIAALLGVRTGTVTSQLHRGRVLLKEKLQEEWEDD